MFIFEQEITGQKGKHSIKDAEIMVPLKYVSRFWSTLEMSLINCEISLRLKWSKDCFLVACPAANQEPEFQIADTKLHVSVATVRT